MRENSWLPPHFEFIARELEAKVRSFKASAEHGHGGKEAEHAFRKLLRQYLPTRFSVSSGFIMPRSEDREQLEDFDETTQIDVIIADTLNNPPLMVAETYSVFTAESVCGVVEITTGQINNRKVKTDIRKLAWARKACERREYLISDFDDSDCFQTRYCSGRLCPRSFLAWLADDTPDNCDQAEEYVRNGLNAILQPNPVIGNPWIHGLYSAKQGWLETRSRAREEGENAVDHDFADWHRGEGKALARFLCVLNRYLSSFPTAHVDLEHYAPGLPDPEDVRSGPSGPTEPTGWRSEDE